MDPEVARLLLILGFVNPHVKDMKMKIVTPQFRRMSLKKHPDKPGGTTEDFQELFDAYEKLGRIIANDEELDDVDETKARAAFNEFNFSKENIYSITIFIQTGMVKFWEKVLSEKFTGPIDRTEEVTGKNNGKQWVDEAFKIDNEENPSKMYITLWQKKNNEHSTLLIQSEKSRQFLNVSYVTKVIPTLYDDALDFMKKEGLTNSGEKRGKVGTLVMTPRVTRSNRKTVTMFPCKVCEYVAKNITQLNNHMKSNHKKNAAT